LLLMCGLLLLLLLLWLPVPLTLTLWAPVVAHCCRARQAARTVPRWRDTIAAVTPGVQHFRSSFLHPTSFSPWS
jgi:type IV secretory pathway TrbD component